MTTKAEQHRQAVTTLIESIADYDLRQQMQSIADGYTQLRRTLNMALAQLRTISADIGFDDDDNERIEQTRDLLAGVRIDELMCLEMIATLDDSVQQAV